MTLVRRCNPTNPVANNLFNDFFGRDFFINSDDYFTNRKQMPAVNIKETEYNFVIEMATPGLKKEDFNISVENGVLTISSEKEEKNETSNEGYTSREFYQASFNRSFRLPKQIADDSNINARYEDGILSITIGKKEEAKPKPKRAIDIA
ncbi:Hsp20/alpha crystallin family protein [Marinilabiliaceae bacterium JC017]|nr:Hsp20/alpha crystallin family protein [Marinilabiliaceae bacterium JC017]